MTDLTVENYTEKSIVVRGDTKPHKEDLKTLGGKWNSNLKDGGGWIFSKKVEDKVLSYVASGSLPKPEEHINAENPDLFVLIEKEFASMSTEAKLAFVARVASLASLKSKPKPSSVSSKPSPKPSPKPSSVDSDVEIEDDEVLRYF